MQKDRARTLGENLPAQPTGPEILRQEQDSGADLGLARLLLLRRGAHQEPFTLPQ